MSSLQLEPRRLTLLKLIYYMPDHPKLLQEFMWQTLDVPPQFPRVKMFLTYWKNEIDAVIFSVEVCAAGLRDPLKFKIKNQIARY